jgi:hypothetical protein
MGSPLRLVNEDEIRNDGRSSDGDGSSLAVAAWGLRSATLAALLGGFSLGLFDLLAPGFGTTLLGVRVFLRYDARGLLEILAELLAFIALAAAGRGDTCQEERRRR